MKFSILIPTRNRLTYLKFAVESVVRQDYQDWEIIISDNDSEEDIASYVHGLCDQRIKYFRTDQLIPVTENWNSCLKKSSGDFIVMLGDDDALMDGYFLAVEKLLLDFRNPDIIYTSAFIYSYPGVIPDFPHGNLHRVSNSLFKPNKPYLLNRARANLLVKAAANFRMEYSFNMQHSVINRELIQRLSNKGAFFQSPYPDFYATNVMFLFAQQILIDPRPLVTIGVTAKSYGNFHFNKKEKLGMDFLRHMPNPESVAPLRNVILPGSTNSTSWLLSMEAIQENFGNQFPFRVNHKRYRFLQILHIYKNRYFDLHPIEDELKELNSLLHWKERVFLGFGFQLFFSLLRILPKSYTSRIVIFLRHTIGQYTITQSSNEGARYKSIIEVFENVDAINC